MVYPIYGTRSELFLNWLATALPDASLKSSSEATGWGRNPVNQAYRILLPGIFWEGVCSATRLILSPDST
jgi:hypothetical protein